ncbi:MAG: DUF4097 family beta strand repeat protein [Clostridia bacterium]|nr:DUF4097 family beta strand repeat protein [Clostridia bacterium]
MKHSTKILLITGALLIAAGLILFVTVMSLNNWNFSKLSTSKYETNSYTISEKFNDILIKTNTADVIFRPSDNEECRVVCYEQKNMKHSVSEDNGTLSIEVTDTRKWYEYIGINFTSPKITVYLPKSEYASLSIKTDTGNIDIPREFSFDSIEISTNTGKIKCCASAYGTVKLKADTGDISVNSTNVGGLDISLSTGDIRISSVNCSGSIKIKVSTGDTDLKDTSCQNLISSGSTGDLSLKNVRVSQMLMAERSTGDINFDRFDAAEIYVKTDTGDVEGTLLSEKVFITETDTGSIDIPKTITGGKCEITTDTGDIEISIVK